MPEPQILPLKGFKSGWITRLPENQVPDDSFTAVQNIRLNEKFLPTKDYGHAKYNPVTIGANICQGGGLYAKADGTKYYIYAFGGKIYYSVAGSGTFTAYQIGGNDLTIDASAEVEMVQYLDKMWIINGKYPVITNGGYATSKMIKIDGTTPSEITVANLPQGGKYPFIHQERIFIAGSTDESNGIYWSNPYDPETWTPEYGLNYDYVGKDDGEIITGIYSYQGYLYVGKPRNLYRYMTLGDITQWKSLRVDTHFGWLYHRTIKEFFGRLLYWSPDGVASFNGNEAVLISEQIRDKMLELPQLESKTAQWLLTHTADFDTGTVGTAIDTADDEVKLKPQTSKADWEAGIVNDVDINVSEGDVKYVGLDSITPTWGSACFVHLDGYIYASKSQGTAQFRRLNLSTGNWEILADIPEDRWGDKQRLTTDGTSVYISSNVVGATHFYRYNIVTNNWDSLASIPELVGYGGAMVYVNPYIYVGGNEHLKTFWRYSISGNSWSQMANIPGTNWGYGATLSVDGTNIYALLNKGPAASFYRYSISGNSWSQMANIPGGGGSYGALVPVSISGYIYAIAGISLGEVVFRRYNIAGNSWDTLENLPVGVSYWPTLMFDNTYIYYTRGERSVANELYRYSIQNNSWTLNPYIISQTLDFGFTPAAYGHLAAEIEGTITFQTASSDTDLSEANWLLATWSTPAQANNTAITSTAKQYFRFRANLSLDSSMSQMYIGAIYRSEKKDLGVTPASWGNYESAYAKNGQTITWWFRTAANTGALDTATWYEQTPGTLISGAAVGQWVQTEWRFNISLYSQQPVVGSIKVIYNSGVLLASPCAVVWKDDYWLNITPSGGTINSEVFRYNKNQFWLRRTNKKNNIYFIDGVNLMSGTSESDGFTRQNDVGVKDDATDIDSWFETKNFELVPMHKIFREMFVTSKGDANWVLSYSLNSGTYVNVTVALKSVADTVRKIFAGIARGRFIKFKVRQSSEDANWELHGADVIWKAWRQLFHE